MTILGEFQSYNYNERAFGSVIQYIILHYTAMESSKEALKWLCSPNSKVSSHYLIDEEGKIFSLVPEKYRAWHAGTPSYWKNQDDINSRSIGIELSNLGNHPFSPRQIKALLLLIKDIQARHEMNPFDVLGHSDVAPTRKIDPGSFFPWKFLASRGFGVWTGRENLKKKEKSPLDVQKSLREFGYYSSLSGVWDAETYSVIRAFLLHFYPEFWMKNMFFLKEKLDDLRHVSGMVSDLASRLSEKKKGMLHSVASPFDCKV